MEGAHLSKKGVVACKLREAVYLGAGMTVCAEYYLSLVKLT
jgi:hypothetical protein